MHTYLLLLHETPADAAPMTATEMKDLIGQYQAWSQSLAEQGLLAGGEKLTDDGGRQLRLQRGQVLASDGPYAEAHDVVGGYFLSKAADDAGPAAIGLTSVSGK